MLFQQLPYFTFKAKINKFFPLVLLRATSLLPSLLHQTLHQAFCCSAADSLFPSAASGTYVGDLFPGECDRICCSCLSPSQTLSSPRCMAPNGLLPSFSTHQVVSSADMSKSVEIILQGLREPLEMIQFSFMRNPPVSVKDSQSESKGEQRFGALRAFTFKEKKSWRVLGASLH